MRTVFVSSTFKDMQYERDEIRRTTAPLLNAEARKHGDEFDFCDLRWGINTAAMESEESSWKVLNVCLDEIDRCKPPMVVLLGYRYGWIPDERLIQNAARRKKMQLDDLQKSITALEIEYGSLSDRGRFTDTLFYFREIEGSFPDDFETEDKEHLTKVNELKERIRQKTGGQIKEYRLRWNGNGFDGVREFARMLAEDIMQKLMPEWEKIALLTPFERERRVHETFISEKASMFRARRAEADEILKKMQSAPFTIIKGEVGSGKSTLFCKLVQEMKQTEWTVLPFIAGLTTQSSDAMDIIRNTIRFLENELQLDTHYGDETDPTTNELTCHSPEEWRNKLAELCNRYTWGTGKKLLIMLDAVDQLLPDDLRDRLQFIPMNLGDDLHFMMTAPPDFSTEGKDYYFLTEISRAGRREVIEGTLSRNGKELSEAVIEKMLSLKSSANPLYLSLLVQRLAMMNADDFSLIRKKGDGMKAIEEYQIELIEQKCPDSLEEMSTALLLEAGSQINPGLVSRVGKFLSLSRSGLRRSDFSALLGKDWIEVDFAHFISYMNDCFMLRDDGRYDFTHKSIRWGFRSLCEDLALYNHQILTHFKVLPDDDPVRVAEITYHSIQADDKPFYVEYVVKHQDREDKAILRQAASDTYRQCLEDDGKWICEVIGDLDLFLPESVTAYFSDFISLSLNRAFVCTSVELRIQKRILTQNVHFAELLHEIVPDVHTKRALSISYLMLAEIDEQLGGSENLQDALSLYRQADELNEQLDHAVDTAETKRELSVSRIRVAGIYEKLGGKEDLERALVYYHKALDIRLQLSTDADTSESKRLLMDGYARIAGLYEKHGDWESLQTALKLYQQALEISKQLCDSEGTAESQRDLSVSYHKAGSIYERLGGRENLENALKLYQEGLEINKQLFKTEGTAVSRSDLSYSMFHTASVYQQLGGEDELKNALSLFQTCLEIRKQLYITVGTAQSKRDLMLIYEKIAGMYEQLGGSENLRQALALYEKGLDLGEQLSSSEGTSQSNRDLMISYSMAAGIHEQLGGSEHLQRALALYQQALEISELLDRTEDTPLSKMDLSVSCERAAVIYQQLGGTENLQRALALYKKDISISEELYHLAETPQSMMDLWTSCDKAAVIYEQLGGRINLQEALVLYQKSQAIKERYDSAEGTPESKRELSVSYMRTAGICEQLGSREDLQTALELYQNSVEINERLATKEQTVSAYDLLAVSLYQLALHPFTEAKTREQILTRALLIAEMLYENMPCERYEAFIDGLKEALSC